jgi:hypothetical protein
MDIQYCSNSQAVWIYSGSMLRECELDMEPMELTYRAAYFEYICLGVLSLTTTPETLTTSKENHQKYHCINNQYQQRVNKMNNVISREQISTLNDTDVAFAWSVTNRDTENMQIVLRAHGFSFGQKEAELAIWIAENQ